MTNQFPPISMSRRQDRKTLYEIFDINYDNNEPKYFNYESRNNEGMMYRIPEHQRYPQWNNDAEQLLIDTVFSNFPMNGFVVSQKNDPIGGIYYDIEDGQSRLSILQKFYNNKFTYKTINGDAVFFVNLPDELKRRFENYSIFIEVMIGSNHSDEIEVFERLQNGTKLKDKDLYWNRKDYVLVNKAINIITQENWLGAYMNTTRGITDKYRNALPSVVTLIYSICNYHINKQEYEELSKRKTMWASYRYQVKKLNEPINEQNEQNEQRINNFLDYLNFIIEKVYNDYPRQPNEKVNTWCNMAKQLGLILYEWLENETATEQEKGNNQNKWIHMILLDRQNDNFMFRGNKNMWNGLSSSSKQNTNDQAIKDRVERVNQYYNNPQATSTEYGIPICQINNNNDDLNTDSSDSS